MSQGLNNDIAVSKTRRVVKTCAGGCWSCFTWRYRQLHHTQLAGNYRAGTESDPRHYYRTILVDRRRVSAGLHDFPAPLCGWLIDVIGLKLGFMICATLGAGLYRPRR